MGDTSDLGIRVGDAERELAVRTLGEHLAAGRLNPGEHEERCTQARIAQTRADLEALFADLPAPHPDLSGVVPPTKPVEPPAVSDTLAGVGFLMLVLGIAASITLTILYGMWWTFFVTGGLVALLFVLSDAMERKEARESPPA